MTRVYRVGDVKAKRSFPGTQFAHLITDGRTPFSSEREARNHGESDPIIKSSRLTTTNVLGGKLLCVALHVVRGDSWSNRKLAALMNLWVCFITFLDINLVLNDNDAYIFNQLANNASMYL